MSEEVNTIDQRTQSLTKEQIEEAMEREVIGIIKNLAKQEIDCSTDEVLKEIEDESIGKEYGSMGGDLGLVVSFPKAVRKGGKRVVAAQGEGMGYINDLSKVLHACFYSTMPT